MTDGYLDHIDMRRKFETGMGLLLVTHDVGVAAESVDDVLVMRHGRLVEQGLREPSWRPPRTTTPVNCSRPYRGWTSAARPRRSKAEPTEARATTPRSTPPGRDALEHEVLKREAPEREVASRGTAGHAAPDAVPAGPSEIVSGESSPTRSARGVRRTRCGSGGA